MTAERQGRTGAGGGPHPPENTVVSRQLYGPGHPYGHTTAEVAAALTATTREDLQRFHQTAFTPTRPH